MRALTITAFAVLILFASCKKSKTITPAATPVQNKLIIWTNNSTAITTGDILVTITQGTNNWGGAITKAYSANPGCGASQCFTIDVGTGVYDVNATLSGGTTTWGPISVTVAANSGCNDLKLQ